MGFSNQSNQNSSLSSLSEINVTPLVDVMLVLLIVFMVSAPLMQQGVQVDLPKANTGALNEVPSQIVLKVDRRKRITLNDKKIAKKSLNKMLKAIADARPDVQVYIQADGRLSYDYVAKVMAVVKQGGIQKVGLVTQPNSEKVKL